MRVAITLATIFFLCMVISGCRIQEEAGGKETMVVVVCSDDDWSDAGPALEKAFSVKEKTLEGQRIFELKRVPAKDMDMYRYRKNLLLMGSIHSDLMKGVLSEDAKVMVSSGESYMFGSLDAWANNQILVMTVSSEDKSLGEITRSTARSAFKYFREECRERIRRRIYSSGIEEGLKAQMKERHGWSIDLPKAYIPAAEDSIGHLVSFIKHVPERVISVYWGFDKERKSWVDIRDEMGARYLQGDIVHRDRYREISTTFRGHKAVKLTGHWENKKKIMGGPFVAYCFQDTISGTYYMVDYNIFAPAEKKWPIVAQMEWIAQTFKIYR
ncbi:DUF4837 family protein [candidate division TA06 bacterium]|uniref:DUF4837 family protein n=1 Tax=candidate division TA06 bacterium TaxID=2250710 RepID=A0A523UN68_UNCT6|nr:MAG: DUF4837 family protein [candidate division TA06 bacterium]